jgi:5-enolpyruvylshikimate-3-phosphate synthase
VRALREDYTEIRKRTIVAAMSAAVLVAGLSAAASAATAAKATATPTKTSAAQTSGTRGCHLGNGIKHVVEITFDQLHAAEFDGARVNDAWQLTAACAQLVNQATRLAS